MISAILSAYSVAWKPMAAMMLILWLASIPLKDSSIVDRFWGLGFVFVAWTMYWQTSGGTPFRNQLLLGMVTLWGVRLSAYLTWRNWGGGEDYRYKEMRDHHQDAYWRVSFVTVFLLQGTLALIIAAPLLIGMAGSPTPAPVVSDWIGLALFLFGFLFECCADYQLTRFKADPSNEGKVLNTGVWRYSRHPNYFGESCLWWGMYGVAWGAQFGPVSIIGPILITWLLLRFSGVVILEANIVERRPKYAQYIERTSAFVPWPPQSLKQQD